MFQPMCMFSRRAGTIAAAAILVFHTAIVQAQTAEAPDAAVGRIDFQKADLPPANVELDLSEGTFDNLFGIGDAAVAGVVETLTKSATGEHAESTRMATEQLAAVRKILGLSSKVIREVRVRAYEQMADDLSSRFDAQLREGDWEKIVVLRKGDENARVFAIQRDKAIRGVFVVAAGKGGQVLVNVVCDISPDNVKNLTSAATKIGLDNGLQQQIEMKFREMKIHTGSPPPPPQLPAPPKPDTQ